MSPAVQNHPTGIAVAITTLLLVLIPNELGADERAAVVGAVGVIVSAFTPRFIRS